MQISTLERDRRRTQREMKIYWLRKCDLKNDQLSFSFFFNKIWGLLYSKVYHLESKVVKFPVTPSNYCWYFFLLQAKPVPGVKIFRFESTIFYANAEYFRSTLIELTGVDPQNPHQHCSIGSGSSVHYRCSPASPSIEITRPIFPGSTVVAHTAWENGVL